MGRNLAWTGLVLLILAWPALGQQRLSLNDARELGATLIAEGQPAAARDIALGLLQADPQDIDALIILSRAERALGNTQTALHAGRAAWTMVTTDGDRFVVATVMAQAHASAANFTRAQVWLRRAAEAAPNEQLASLAARDYAALRNANPWSFNLSFGATPSNNVNNGNSNNTLTFAFLPGALANVAWEVPADDRPLSGLALTAQAELAYRLARSTNSQTTLGLDIFAQGYVLSDRARRTAPDVTAQSLSYQQAGISMAHTWLPAGATGPFSVDFSVTQSLYGGDPYTRDVALTFARQWQSGEAQVFSASLSANQTTYLSDKSRTEGLALRGAWQHSLGNADVLGLSFTVSDVHADQPDRGYAAVGAQVSYDFGEIASGLELSVAGSLERRVYDASNYDPAGRTDLRSTLQVNLGLPELAVYGFAPVATVSANQTNSSVPFFETESVRVGLQIKSTF